MYGATTDEKEPSTSLCGEERVSGRGEKVGGEREWKMRKRRKKGTECVNVSIFKK